MTGKKLILSALVLALIQIGFLGWIIAGRAAILRDGQEVLLRIRPIDPRDFLRGDYVRLDYDLSRIKTDLIANIGSRDQPVDGDPLIVPLKPGAEGLWEPQKAWLGAADGAPAAGEVDIKGSVEGGWTLALGTTVSVDYGIERFYVPEGEGLAIQNDLRERPFSMKVAVGPDGTAQTKALMDEGKMLYEEPLY